MKATISGYYTYFSTGPIPIPFNPKRPSKKAKLMMKFFGLSSLLRKVEEKKP